MLERGSRLRRNVFSGMVSAVLQMATLLLSYPLCLNYLGYEEFGVWLLLNSVLALAKVGDLGMATATAKLISEEHERGNVSAVARYTASSILLLAFAGLIASLLVVLLKIPIARIIGVNPEATALLLRYLPPVAALAALGLVWEGLYAALSGIGRLDLANYLQVGSRALYFISLCLLLPMKADMGTLIIASLIGLAASGFVMVCLILRCLSIRDLAYAHDSSRRLIRFGAGVFGGSLVGMLFTPLSRVFLARYGGVALVPIFEVPFRSAMHLRSLLEVGLRALMTEGSRLSARGSDDASSLVSALNIKMTGFVVKLFLPGMLILFMTAKALLQVWLGSSFHPLMVPTFQVMLVATFFSVLAVPPFYLSLGCGRVRSCFRLHVMNSGIGLGLILAVALVTGQLTPLAMAWCLAVTYALSLSAIVGLSSDLFFSRGVGTRPSSG